MGELNRFGTTTGELVCHTICLMLTFIGAVMVWVTVTDNTDIDGATENRTSVYICSAVVLSFFMLINAGRAMAPIFPLSVALGYFWFPAAIHFTDIINNTDTLKDSDQDTIVAGFVFCLIGTIGNILVECSFPKGGRLSSFGPAQYVAFVAMWIVVIGCCITWATMDRDNDSDYDDTLTRTIEALISLVFVLDAIVFPSTITVAVAMFIGCFTAIFAIDDGIQYGNFSDDDIKTSRQGILVVGLGLVIMLFCSIATGSKGADGVTRSKMFKKTQTEAASPKPTEA